MIVLAFYIIVILCGLGIFALKRSRTIRLKPLGCFVLAIFLCLVIGLVIRTQQVRHPKEIPIQETHPKDVHTDAVDIYHMNQNKSIQTFLALNNLKASGSPLDITDAPLKEFMPGCLYRKSEYKIKVPKIKDNDFRVYIKLGLIPQAVFSHMFLTKNPIGFSTDEICKVLPSGSSSYDYLICTSQESCTDYVYVDIDIVEMKDNFQSRKIIFPLRSFTKSPNNFIVLNKRRSDIQTEVEYYQIVMEYKPIHIQRYEIELGPSLSRSSNSKYNPVSVLATWENDNYLGSSIHQTKMVFTETCMMLEGELFLHQSMVSRSQKTWDQTCIVDFVWHESYGQLKLEYI